MATLSYTLYDYAYAHSVPVTVDPTVATSDAIFVISTNGYFPNLWSQDENGEWVPADLDGSLEVSIDGIYIGELYWGPPDDDASGYFVDSGNGFDYGTAIIPRDVWREIIADGQLQITYTIGPDAESRATPANYIRADVNWLEYYNGVRGSPDGDVIVVTDPTIIEGRGGNDDITGSDFGDIIMGGIGDDLINGAGGQDSIRGDDGDDHFDAGAGDDVVLGGNGADEIAGGLGADRLRGNDGNDLIDGGEGDDVLWGDNGDDALTAGHGNNHLFGGDGADEFVFSAASGPETQHVYDFDRSEGDQLVYMQDFDEVIDAINIRVGKDGSVVTIFNQHIVVSGVFDLTPEDIVFRPIPEPFPFAASAASAPPLEVVRGTDGHDELSTAVPAIMFGLGGDDWLTGSDGDDTIMGGDGEDQIDGLEGDNIIRGDDGADLIGTGGGRDTISAGAGNDLVYAGGGDDRLVGGADDDHMMGGQGNDLLWGEADNDWLVGDDGNDRLWGGAGNDMLVDGHGDDYVWGGEGNDSLWGGDGDNHLFGGAGRDSFIFNSSTSSGTQHIYDFDRSAGEQISYLLDYDDYADSYDLRVGKDGTVITILDTTIILSGVFDFQPTDLMFGTGAEWPV